MVLPMKLNYLRGDCNGTFSHVLRYLRLFSTSLLESRWASSMDLNYCASTEIERAINRETMVQGKFLYRASLLSFFTRTSLLLSRDYIIFALYLVLLPRIRE